MQTHDTASHNDNTFSVTAPFLLAPPTPLEGALDMARQGWRLFPLAPGTKEPIKGFTDYFHRASSQEAEILAWEKEFPGCNWGAILEPWHMVVDVDAKPGKPNGPVNWRCFQASHATLPEAPIVWSGAGQGACHIYFRVPEGTQLHYARLYEEGPFAGMDVFGKGHYMVAPGSVHPDTGNIYRHDPLHNFGTVATPIAPEWFLTWLETEHIRLKKLAEKRSDARRLSPVHGKTPDVSLLVKGEGARENKGIPESPQVLRGPPPEKANTCGEAPKHQALTQRLAQRLHQEEATRAPLLQALGLDTGPVTCPVCGGTKDDYGNVARWHEAYEDEQGEKHGQRGIYCFRCERFYGALDLLYRRQCPKGLLTAGHTKPLPGPSLCVLTALFLLDMGCLMVPLLETDALPEDLPDDARTLAEMLILVKRARSATRDDQAPMPLGWRFYCDWLGWTDYRFDQARLKLRALAPAFLYPEGGEYLTHVGNPQPKLKLWKLATKALEALKHASAQIGKELAAQFPVSPPALDTMPEASDPAHNPDDWDCPCRDCLRELAAWEAARAQRNGYGLGAVP